MANVLSRERRIQVLNLLVEGMSIRAISRVTGVHKGAILRLLVLMGEGCEMLHNELVHGLDCQDLQLDEVWAFVAKKQKNCSTEEKRSGQAGDAYTFTGLDRKSKLIISWLTGKRNYQNTLQFCQDVFERIEIDEENLPQVSSDAFDAYENVMEEVFGAWVNYGQVIKDYATVDAGRGRYSPGKVISIDKRKVIGKPDRKKICTSHVERQNLTIRMQMRRFTRLTNAFSKKLDNLKAAVALHFMHYNFVRVHSSLRVTPAMEAGLADHVWSMGELLDAALEAHQIEQAA